MLGVDRITFRDMFNQWLNENDDMKEILQFARELLFNRLNKEVNNKYGY